MFRLIINDRELRLLFRLLDGQRSDDAASHDSLVDKVTKIVDCNLDALERIQAAEGTPADRGTEGGEG